MTNALIATLLLIATIPLAAQQHITSPDMRCSRLRTIDIAANNSAATSPDGKYAACIKEDAEDAQAAYTGIYVANSRGVERLHRYRDIGPSRAPAWSPDSSAFAFNWTGGGATGIWYVDVFQVGRRNKLPIGISSSRDFLRQFHCDVKKEAANVFFLKWLNHTNVLLAVRLYPAMSDCRQEYSTEVAFYEVSVPSDRIVRRLQGVEKKQAKSEFKGDY